MIQKIVKRRQLQEPDARQDLAYWLTRPPEERIAAVEMLRRQRHGTAIRLQRVARVIKRSSR
jgi:hypothetical protein